MLIADLIICAFSINISVFKLGRYYLLILIINCYMGSRMKHIFYTSKSTITYVCRYMQKNIFWAPEKYNKKSTRFWGVLFFKSMHLCPL